MAEKIYIKQKSFVSIKEPKDYKVVMYNDDFTPMDFVVDILTQVFHKKYEEAVAIMMSVHKGKKAVVGVYSYDIARSRVEKASAMARDEGYPFRVLVEEN